MRRKGEVIERGGREKEIGEEEEEGGEIRRWGTNSMINTTACSRVESVRIS